MEGLPEETQTSPQVYRPPGKLENLLSFFSQSPWKTAFLAVLVLFFLSLALWGQKVGKPVPQAPTPPFVSYEQAREQALTTKGKFSQEQIVARVGKENLYGRDLNYKLFVYYPEVLPSQGEVAEEIKKKILDQVIEESLILQAAEKRGVISLNSAVFNHSDKDYPQRVSLYNKAKDELPSQIVDRASGEGISLWFYNTNPPKMGVEAAKKVTLAKMKKLDEEIKSGKINFKEAGEQIKADKELSEIDPAYKTNAYVFFANLEREKPRFHDPELEKAFWALEEGDTSEILTGRDFGLNGQSYEAFFILLKVNKRSLTGYSGFADWLGEEKKNYEIKILI